MKKLFTFILMTIGVASVKDAVAQSLSFGADTVTFSASGTYNAASNITNSSGSNMTVQWKVVSTNFPSDWLTNTGICDNSNCYTTSYFWPTTINESTYPAGEGDFHLTMDLSTVATAGPYYLRVRANNKFGSDTAWTTFIASKTSVGVSMVRTNSNVVLYPNPATNSVNIIYDASADVKTIALYNIIGRQVNLFRPTDNGSANLNIDSVPSGIYFVRLINSRGDVVATRKFTKQ